MLEQILLEIAESLVVELGTDKRPEENEKREVRLEFWKKVVRE